MTVGELIAQLNKYPDDLDVYLLDSNEGEVEPSNVKESEEYEDGVTIE